MTNQEMLKTAMKQSAEDIGCAADDFLKSNNVTVPFYLGTNARKYYKLPISCNLVSYGNNVVAAVTDEVSDLVTEYVGRYEFYHCFETPNMHWLNERLIKKGYKICFMAGVDRYYASNAGNADIVESRLREMSADYMILESDISDEEAVKEIYQTAMDRFGKIDILVNNAATDDENGLDTIEKITRNVIDDTFAVNVRGSILMTREFVNHRGYYGRIIHISTDAAQVFAGQITYGASKATLEALTRSIALEVAKYGITVNCVAPGPTQTGWIDDEFEKVVVPLIPLGELIQPEDIADTILFLASERARMLTGQVIKVSGGHAL